MIPDFYNKFNKDISWIKDKTIYLAVHGSRAYGTNVETSDYDYRGITICPKQYYFGALQSNFEQAELKDPDSVIYEIRKFVKLAAEANPNCMEVLFVDESDIIHITELGQELLDNRDLFITKKVKHTMCGYAYSQLKKMQHKRQLCMNPPSKYPTRKDLGLPEETIIPQDQLAAANAEVEKELNKMQFDFMENLDEATKIEIRSSMAKMLTDLKISKEDQWQSAAKTIGLSDNLIEVMKLERAYASKKREWDQYQEWLSNRNKARAADEAKYGFDLKNGLHLVRLLKMAKEILLTGKVIVKRPDKEELLDIRNGKKTYEEIMTFAGNIQKELDEIYLSSKLPISADKQKIDNLCINLIEKSLKS